MSYTMTKETPKAFSRAQYEIVNMMSCLDSDADCLALKSVLVKFLDQRLQREMDRLYDIGSLSDGKMEELSHRHLRTPYRHCV